MCATSREPSFGENMEAGEQTQIFVKPFQIFNEPIINLKKFK